MKQVAVKVIAYVPLRPAAVRRGGCTGADCHRAAAQTVQTVVGDGDAGLLHAVHADGLAGEAAAGVVAAGGLDYCGRIPSDNLLPAAHFVAGKVVAELNIKRIIVLILHLALTVHVDINTKTYEIKRSIDKDYERRLRW